MIIEIKSKSISSMFLHKMIDLCYFPSLLHIFPPLRLFYSLLLFSSSILFYSILFYYSPLFFYSLLLFYSILFYYSPLFFYSLILFSYSILFWTNQCLNSCLLGGKPFFEVLTIPSSFYIFLSFHSHFSLILPALLHYNLCYSSSSLFLITLLISFLSNFSSFFPPLFSSLPSSSSHPPPLLPSFLPSLPPSRSSTLELSIPESFVALPALRIFSKPSRATVTTLMSVTCNRPQRGGIVPERERETERERQRKKEEERDRGRERERERERE